MRTFTESSDDLLTGAINGVNTVFTASRTMRLDLPVLVYVNGALRQADWANGYDLLDGRTLRLREAPMAAEEVSITYCAEPSPVVVVGAGQSPDFSASAPQPGPLSASVERPLPLQASLADLPQGLTAVVVP